MSGHLKKLQGNYYFSVHNTLSNFDTRCINKDKQIYLINKIDNAIINSTINLKALFQYLE